MDPIPEKQNAKVTKVIGSGNPDKLLWLKYCTSNLK